MMTLEEAKSVLGARVQLINDCDIGLSTDVRGQLYNHWILYAPGDKDVALDGDFTADELEAIAVFMRHSESPA